MGAFATTSPARSRTVPVMVPVFCADAVAVDANSTAAMMRNRINERMRLPSALQTVDRGAFGLAQNQARHRAAGVQEELRHGAGRLELRLRQRNERKSVQVQ